MSFTGAMATYSAREWSPPGSSLQHLHHFHKPQPQQQQVCRGLNLEPSILDDPRYVTDASARNAHAAHLSPSDFPGRGDHAEHHHHQSQFQDQPHQQQQESVRQEQMLPQQQLEHHQPHHEGVLLKLSALSVRHHHHRHHYSHEQKTANVQLGEAAPSCGSPPMLLPPRQPKSPNTVIAVPSAVSSAPRASAFVAAGGVASATDSPEGTAGMPSGQQGKPPLAGEQHHQQQLQRRHDFSDPSLSSWPKEEALLSSASGGWPEASLDLPPLLCNSPSQTAPCPLHSCACLAGAPDTQATVRRDGRSGGAGLLRSASASSRLPCCSSGSSRSSGTASTSCAGRCSACCPRGEFSGCGDHGQQGQQEDQRDHEQYGPHCAPGGMKKTGSEACLVGRATHESRAGYGAGLTSLSPPLPPGSKVAKAPAWPRNRALHGSCEDFATQFLQHEQQQHQRHHLQRQQQQQQQEHQRQGLQQVTCMPLFGDTSSSETLSPCEDVSSSSLCSSSSSSSSSNGRDGGTSIPGYGVSGSCGGAMMELGGCSFGSREGEDKEEGGSDNDIDIDIDDDSDYEAGGMSSSSATTDGADEDDFGTVGEMETSKPRPGLSSFFMGKSRSFTSLADVASISTIQDLAKPARPRWMGRRKNRSSSSGSSGGSSSRMQGLGVRGGVGSTGTCGSGLLGRNGKKKGSSSRRVKGGLLTAGGRGSPSATAAAQLFLLQQQENHSEQMGCFMLHGTAMGWREGVMGAGPMVMMETVKEEEAHWVDHEGAAA